MLAFPSVLCSKYIPNAFKFLPWSSIDPDRNYFSYYYYLAEKLVCDAVREEFFFFSTSMKTGQTAVNTLKANTTSQKLCVIKTLEITAVSFFLLLVLLAFMSNFSEQS